MAHQNYFTYIGLARSGSSWLHAYLKDHTTAQMTTMKEISWIEVPPCIKQVKFTARCKARWADIQNRVETEGIKLQPHHLEIRDRAAMRSDTDYQRFFTSRADPDAVFGDITPRNGRLQKDGFERILALFPNAKMIFPIRNPADNIWSRAAHSARRKRHDEPMEDHILRRLEAVANDADVPPAPQIYNNAAQYVSPENIHTLYTEHLFSDQADDTLAKLCDFLAIKGGPVAKHEFTRNRGSYHPMPEHVRSVAVQHFAQSYHWAFKNVPNLPENWQRDIDTYL